MMSFTLSRIRLELARTPDFPEGSSQHGYELIAPLAGDGHVDAETWRHRKEACTVTRFWGEAPEERGHLVHRHGGWGFDYGGGDGEDELFFRLDRHVFLPGAYVTLTERDGKQYPFRVIEVTPATP